MTNGNYFAIISIVERQQHNNGGKQNMKKLKQKLIGIGLIAIGILSISILPNNDATAALLFIPLGVYATFTKKEMNFYYNK